MINIPEVLKQLTLEEKASLCSGEDNWNTKSIERLGIPNIRVSDGPHGVRTNSPNATCFPTACCSACSFDVEVMKEMGQALGEECQDQKVDILLGPGACIKRSPLCGRNFEYFSEDPLLSSKIASGLIQGVQSKGVGTCMKHYACNNQEKHRFTYSANVSERALHEIYLASFETAVREGKPYSLMCAYNKINGVYAAENHYTLTEVLRDMWGFDGIVISDWGAVNDRVADLVAGLELEMPSSCGLNDALIVKAVDEGKLDISVLDRAVTRLLETINKCIAGRKPAPFSVEEHKAIAKKISDASIVLLKNERNILPLKKEQNVVFIGPYAKSPYFEASGSSFIMTKNEISALQAAKDITTNLNYFEGNEENLDEAVKAAKEADVAVVFVGLDTAIESEGFDRKNMKMPERFNKLVKEVAKANPNTVVVLHNGSAIEMEWLDDVPAIIETFLGGQAVGASTADILYGIVNPSGKLAESFPIKLEDNPSYLNFAGDSKEINYSEEIFVGYRYYEKKNMKVNFPFGHGLSYTTFLYSDIKVSEKSIDDTQTVDVSFTLKNTGSVEGKEAVQLYVGDDESTYERPVKELKAFQKISLKPGESKEVKFTLGKRDFAYWNPEIHNWHVETGSFTIYIGSSSADIRLTEKIVVKSTQPILRKITLNSTLQEIKDIPGAEELIETIKGAMPFGNFDELGEGGNAMAAEMAKTSPMRCIVQFSGGIFTFSMLNEIIDKFNNIIASQQNSAEQN